ncbi:MAG: hypothetical protein Q9177_005183 [Variospora cf. flavescens]
MSQYPAETANSSHIKEPGPSDALALLNLHGMYIRGPQDGCNYRNFPALAAKVHQIISAPSQSDMTPGSAVKIINDFERLKSRSEKKIFESFWARIFKKSHPLQEGLNDGKWDTEQWAVQGLDNNPDEVFTVEGCSNLQTSGEQKAFHDLVLEVYPKVKRPKPDQTFGIRRSMFSDEVNHYNDLIGRWSGVSTGMYHAFALIEFKGPKCMEEAENQALRGGSTLVKVTRTMLNEAGMLNLEELGADATNFIFSFCMNPQAARLHIHWATVELVGNNRITKYNMSLVRMYGLYHEGDLRMLRKDLGLVLLWGTTTRLQGVRTMLAKLMQKKASLLDTLKMSHSSHGSKKDGSKKDKSKKGGSSGKAAKSQPESSAGAVTRSQAGG